MQIIMDKTIDDLYKAMSKNIDDLYKELMDAQERLQFQTLRQRGIITNMVLFLNPKHKAVMEEALYEAGIQKIPIIYSAYIEEDKMYCSTDVDFVDAVKRSLIWKGEWDDEH